jgi:hypothetical protein
MKLCSNVQCRRALNRGGTFCPNCGTRVGSHGGSTAFIVVFGITGAVLLLGALGLASARHAPRMVPPTPQVFMHR